MKTQTQVRAAFWMYINEVAPEYKDIKRTNKRQNDYPADVRMLFCEYVETERRNGNISEKLAYKVTL